jgi:hypothetical protein
VQHVGRSARAAPKGAASPHRRVNARGGRLAPIFRRKRFVPHRSGRLPFLTLINNFPFDFLLQRRTNALRSLDDGHVQRLRVVAADDLGRACARVDDRRKRGDARSGRGPRHRCGPDGVRRELYRARREQSAVLPERKVDLLRLRARFCSSKRTSQGSSGIGYCKLERLVALSCNGRGFCPSCGGKRMTDISAHLTDRVVPFVPVRQFVLSFPYWLRYRPRLRSRSLHHCAQDLHARRARLLPSPRARARRARGRSGSVTFVQRFGSAANLNLHAHAIVLDGVFGRGAKRRTAFSPHRPAERRRHRQSARNDSCARHPPPRAARPAARRRARPLQRRGTAARELLRNLDRAPRDARQTPRIAPTSAGRP